jgi:hypothetical protein
MTRDNEIRPNDLEAMGSESGRIASKVPTRSALMSRVIVESATHFRIARDANLAPF